MRHTIQTVVAGLLVIASLTVSSLADRDSALAVDTTLSTCDELSFRGAIQTAASGGGGTITIACGGPISFFGTDPIQIDSNITILGNDVRLDGDDVGVLFTVSPGARLELNHLTISDFVAADSDGGAIRNNGTLVINDTTFRSSSARFGGAIISHGAGEVTITNSTFERNAASDAGGAIVNEGGTVNIVNSTFDNNSAEVAGGAIVTKADDLGDPGLTTITASTFFNNSAPDGAAVYTEAGTVGGSLTITGSIFADSAGEPNCGGLDPLSSGYNLSDDESCNLTGPGDLAGSSHTIGLGFLQNNGGLTDTRQPEPGSAAVDAADCALMPATDQRGVARQASGMSCDIGSVETAYLAVGPVSVNPSPSDEGQSILAEAGFTDPDDEINYGCTVTFGDGTGVQAGTVSGTTCHAPAHSYTDDGTYDVTIRVCDNGTDCHSSTIPHTVMNVAPTVEAGGDQAAIEGEVVQLDPATFTDAGTQDTHACAIDWDDGSPGERGVIDESGGSGTCAGSHTYSHQGVYSVEVCVTDSDLGTGCDQLVVTVESAAPSVAMPLVTPSDSSEGSSVVASATFSDASAIDSHTCTVDYGDGSGELDGTVDGNTCTGPQHTYLDDGTYTVAVMVCDNDGNCDSNSSDHAVSNLAPVIKEIVTNAPVPQGQPVTITVIASDPGVNDVLSYSFDCDDDDIFEISPDADSTAECALDTAAATTTIHVLVEDGDGGSVTGSVVVGQTLVLCRNNLTGALTQPAPGRDCPTGSGAVNLPGNVSTTVCIANYTGALTLSPTGNCGARGRAHRFPDDGPLAYCRNTWTGHLRYPQTGQCQEFETTGVIPGVTTGNRAPGGGGRTQQTAPLAITGRASESFADDRFETRN